jgi:hypothetical protein
MSGFKNLLIGVALIGVVGLLLLIAAHHLELPILIGPGLLLFAAGVFAAGLHAIIGRYVVERRDQLPGSYVFHGAAAILIGVVVLVAAAAFAVAGIAFLIGREHAVFEFLLDRPGPALFAAGLAAGAAGAARILGAQEWKGSLTTFLMHLPERIGGVMLLALGMALLAVGAFEIVAPEAFDALLDSLLEPLNSAVPG